MSERLAVFFDSCIFDHDTGQGFFEADASPYLRVMEKHPENVKIQNRGAEFMRQCFKK